jgi:ABC-type Mn2+/Zn2+ transport system ATPase subunit
VLTSFKDCTTRKIKYEVLKDLSNVVLIFSHEEESLTDFLFVVLCIRGHLFKHFKSTHFSFPV